MFRLGKTKWEGVGDTLLQIEGGGGGGGGQ